MYPWLHLWGLTFSTYGVAMASAFLLCGLILWRNFPRQLFSITDALNFCIIVLIVTLFITPQLSLLFRFLIVNTNDYHSGQSSFVAIAVSLALIYGYCKLLQLPFLPIIDVLTPYALFAFTIQRSCGCFLAGCCYGSPTTLWWGITFPPTAPASIAFPGHAVHPVQLLYAAAACTGWLISWIAKSWSLLPGINSSLSLGWFALISIPISTLRGYHSANIWGWSFGQWSNLLVLIWCISVIGWVVNKESNKLAKN